MTQNHPMFIGNCPRCDQSQTTFDILAESSSNREDLWAPLEIFVRCRACGTPSVALITQTRSFDGGTGKFQGQFINVLYDFVEWVFNVPSKRHVPTHVPENVGFIFDEAATCTALNCWNAAGMMFRKVLDVATREKAPDPESSTEIKTPNWKTYRDLRLRLDWLFVSGLLDVSLQDLSSCIHQDGNDAAHADDGIGKDEVEDIADFTERVLEVIYTLPGQIEANKKRRDERRGAVA